MGSSQSSQSGDTVNITIETEEGEADVKVSSGPNDSGPFTGRSVIILYAPPTTKIN